MIKTSSGGWPRIFSFVLFSIRSTSCSIGICAFALIPFLEYDVLFLSIFVIPFTLVFKQDGSSFATHCSSFCLDCSSRSRVGCSDSSILCVSGKKNYSSSATSEEDVVTSIGVVWISFRIFRRMFTVTLSSNLEKKSAAVLIDPAMFTILKLNCNT